MRRMQPKILSSASIAVLALSLTAGTSAYAQDVQSDTPEELEQTEVELESGQDIADPNGPSEGSILVTGSRIRRPNLDSTVPITSVGVQELTDSGNVSLGDALNDLPSLASTFSQSNSTRFIGTAGLNLLDLRALGTQRTLTLVNNRRHVTAAPGTFQVDTNTIPVDLLERVDVITGGNSAIYGSDAVAGVVNFVTRRDYDGVNVRAQSGISDEGDRASNFVALTAGRNFLDNRANVAVSFEYAKSEPLYFTDRPDQSGAYDGRCQFNLAEPTTNEDPDGDGNATDGIPDNQYFCGVKNATISTGGTIGLLSHTSALRFNSNGDIFVDTTDKSFTPFGSGNWIGGEGSTLRETGQLAAGLTRYVANLLARVEISPAFQPFLEAKYVHVDAIQEGQASFFQPISGRLDNFFGGGPRGIPCDYAFLSQQNLTTLQSFGLCSSPTGTFPLTRFNVDFGGRGELHDRDTYRIVGGVEGDFLGDWRYELSVNYGRLETSMRSLNNLVLFDLDGNEDGFLLALDSVRGANGQPVCRVNVDADPTNNRPDCVPINVLGYGAPSQEALNFVNTTGMREEWAEQIDVLAFVSGTSSRWFELPGGPVGFALGAEYRTEDAYYAWDELTASGGTFLNAIAPFEPPQLEIKEAFAELRIPLLRDLPFMQELTLEAAARVSDYNLGSTGTVWAYNVGGTWAPVRDIRFRGNYSRSVRAPDLLDLFETPSQNFAFLADPCDALNIQNNPNRAANCAAAGVPTTGPNCVNPSQTGPWGNCPSRAASVGYLSGGNPELSEETGTSLTVGTVIQPRWIPGLSMTVDYYDIEIKNAIQSLGPQVILNECYNAPGGIDNPFCPLINRDPATGFFENPALLSGPVNFARLVVEGIDAEIAYRRSFSNGHKLDIRGIASYVIENTGYLDPGDPTVPNRFKSEMGVPAWAANLNVNYDFGDFDIRYGLRFIGRQIINAITYETVFPFAGDPPTNEDAAGLVDGTVLKWEDPVFYHDVRLGIDIDDGFQFYVGVDNVLDKLPPHGLTGGGFGSGIFDVFGRFFYAGVNVKIR